MLTAAGSPLVNGTSNPMDIKTVKVKVLRAFLIKAERQEVGKVLDMERRLALELASLNKLEILKAEAPAPVAEVKAKKVKEASHVGQ